MTKRNKVQLFEQIRKAHAKSENPSIRDLSRTFKACLWRAVRVAFVNVQVSVTCQPF